MEMCAETLAAALARVNLLLLRRLNRQLRAHGASFSQVKILKYIDYRNGLGRASDIAEIFDLTPRSVTELIDGLEREGLIARAPDAHDRRVKRLMLTEAGRGALAATEPLRCAVIAEVFGCLSVSETSAMQAMFDKVLDRLGGH